MSQIIDEAVLWQDPPTIQDVLDRELARWFLRRLANRHGCSAKGCPDPEQHAEDAAEIGPVWEALGLAYTDEQSGPVRESAPASKAATERFRAALPRMEWSDDAACRFVAPDLHFPVKTCGPDFEVQAREAKQVCAGCPVRYRCLKWALDRNEQYGIWGGYTADERKSMRRREQRKARAA